MRALYVTHPQVRMDANVPVPLWGLSDEGRRRAEALAASGVIPTGAMIFSSRERKALELAELLAAASGTLALSDHLMGENDRSATGFLPPATFEETADRFLRPARTEHRWLGAGHRRAGPYCRNGSNRAGQRARRHAGSILRPWCSGDAAQMLRRGPPDRSRRGPGPHWRHRGRQLLYLRSQCPAAPLRVDAHGGACARLAGRTGCGATAYGLVPKATSTSEEDSWLAS